MNIKIRSKQFFGSLLALAMVLSMMSFPASTALAANPGDIVINEIIQNPSAVGDSDGEWFELFNATDSPVNINGWTIRDDDIDIHVIDNGGALEIPAGGYLVLGNNADTSTNGGVSVAYEFPSNFYLGNSGDELVLLDETATEIDRVMWDDGATFPDPNGASMSLIDPALDNNVGANWCTSVTPFGAGDLGTPGAANVCPVVVPEVIINEILQNPYAVGDGVGEWFELFNPTANPIDIDGWTIQDNDIDSHVISNGGPLEIPAGGYLLLGNNIDIGTNGGVNVGYQYPGNFYLGNSADELVLLDSDLNEVDRVEWDNGVTFPDPNGASMSLIDPSLDNNIGANWCTSVTPFGAGDLGTPGAANVCPVAVPEVVINEIIQNPAAVYDSKGEWFELYNPTDSAIDIDGWTIKDNDYESHVIANGGPLVIPAEGYLVLGNNADSATNGGVAVDYQYPSNFYLSNSYDELVLLDNFLSEVDRVEWDNGATFPDPNGASMSLIDPAEDNNIGANWCTSVTPFGVGDLGTPGIENVCSILPIGEVQGVVEDTDDGMAHRSPYAPPSGNGWGDWVVVQGVIYAKTLQRSSSGGNYYGFFIQNTAETADGDPLSSDGIFVFHSRYDTLRIDGGGYYTPQIGDEVILRGPVVEYYNLTQLSSPYLLAVVRNGVVLDDEIPAFETAPADDVGDANRYWERHEGMRAQVPAGSVVLNGRDVFASSADSEIWVMRGDHPLAQRPAPYERRSFRDAHPLDDIPDQVFDNGNGYRIIMGGLGVKATADDNTELLAPARTFDTLNNAPIGGVYFSYSKYQIQVEQQLDLSGGFDPSQNTPPQPATDLEYSIVTFNMENLYDYRDDPFDGCDFHTDSGCPGVDPPFDYVPVSDAIYQTRLNEIANQIVFDLHSPDVIMAQEIEDQDICTADVSGFACDFGVNNADGKPDPLQELATLILALGGPQYDAAFDRDGADDRGIVSAYLFRTDRAELLTAQADHPVLGSDPEVNYPDGLSYNTDVQNPKALNAVLPEWVPGDTDGDNVFTRPPQVALFRLWRDGIGMSVFENVYLLDNHFSSGPDRRVGQRTEQAVYNAAIVDALQAADPDAYVSVGGDMNVYPRPDDPFPTPDESDQLAALYNQGMTNLWDILVVDSPVSAYGYIYQGQAQTLDQIFSAPVMRAELAQVWSAHINSDFPADYHGDGPRGTSDHDPLIGLYMLHPTFDRLEALVLYFDARGDIFGVQTTRILLDRINKAERFKERGKMDAYTDQIYAFASQVQDLAPEQISQEAADALAREALLLLTLP
jgi:predicted extracellular nuclease